MIGAKPAPKLGQMGQQFEQNRRARQRRRYLAKIKDSLVPVVLDFGRPMTEPVRDTGYKPHRYGEVEQD